MKLTQVQLYSILGFTLLLLILLFGFRTKPNELIEREKTRALNVQSTTVNILIQEASSTLSDVAKSRIQILESQINNASEAEKVELYKELSSVWYSSEQPGIAGHYAEQVAVLTESAEAWGIAGTTYGLCVKRSDKEKERTLCLAKTLETLENAISLEPENIDYKINKAVIQAENPPADNPMTGVLQLLDLNKKFPKNVPVINNIAKFALQTNQLDKAEQRLYAALAIEPDNITSNCLLAQLYMAKGDENKASEFQEKCGQ